MKLNNEHPKKHGFNTPENYFKSFDDKLFDTLSQSLIDKTSSGFQTPDGYFENLDDTILSKAKSEAKVVSFKPNSKLYYVVGIAASLVLLFAIYVNNETPAEISAEMVENYLNNSDLDSYELAELLSEAEILEEDFVVTETNYNEDNLEDYLLEHTDIEELLQ